MTAALVLLADRRGNGRRLQAVERCAQPLIMVLARPAPDEGQNLVRTGGDVPRWRAACVARFNELTRRPNQNVGIPDGRHAVFGYGFDRDPCGPHCEVDRCGAPRLGKAEEGPGHQILSIARGNVTGHRVEQVELLLGAHRTHQRRTGRADRQMPCPGSDVELRRPFCAQASRSTMA